MDTVTEKVRICYEEPSHFLRRGLDRWCGWAIWTFLENLRHYDADAFDVKLQDPVFHPGSSVFMSLSPSNSFLSTVQMLSQPSDKIQDHLSQILEKAGIPQKHTGTDQPLAHGYLHCFANYVEVHLYKIRQQRTCCDPEDVDNTINRFLKTFGEFQDLVFGGLLIWYAMDTESSTQQTLQLLRPGVARRVLTESKLSEQFLDSAAKKPRHWLMENADAKNCHHLSLILHWITYEDGKLANSTLPVCAENLSPKRKTSSRFVVSDESTFFSGKNGVPFTHTLLSGACLRLFEKNDQLQTRLFARVSGEEKAVGGITCLNEKAYHNSQDQHAKSRFFAALDFEFCWKPLENALAKFDIKIEDIKPNSDPFQDLFEVHLMFCDDNRVLHRNHVTHEVENVLRRYLVHIEIQVQKENPWVVVYASCFDDQAVREELMDSLVQVLYGRDGSVTEALLTAKDEIDLSFTILQPQPNFQDCSIRFVQNFVFQLSLTFYESSYIVDLWTQQLRARGLLTSILKISPGSTFCYEKFLTNNVLASTTVVKYDRNKRQGCSLKQGQLPPAGAHKYCYAREASGAFSLDKEGNRIIEKVDVRHSKYKTDLPRDKLLTNSLCYVPKLHFQWNHSQFQFTFDKARSEKFASFIANCRLMTGDDGFDRKDYLDAWMHDVLFTSIRVLHESQSDDVRHKCQNRDDLQCVLKLNTFHREQISDMLDGMLQGQKDGWGLSGKHSALSVPSELLVEEKIVDRRNLMILQQMIQEVQIVDDCPWSAVTVRAVEHEKADKDGLSKSLRILVHGSFSKTCRDCKRHRQGGQMSFRLVYTKDGLWNLLHTCLDRRCDNFGTEAVVLPQVHMWLDDIVQLNLFNDGCYRQRSQVCLVRREKRKRGSESSSPQSHMAVRDVENGKFARLTLCYNQLPESCADSCLFYMRQQLCANAL